MDKIGFTHRRVRHNWLLKQASRRLYVNEAQNHSYPDSGVRVSTNRPPPKGDAWTRLRAEQHRGATPEARAHFCRTNGLWVVARTPRHPYRPISETPCEQERAVLLFSPQTNALGFSEKL